MSIKSIRSIKSVKLIGLIGLIKNLPYALFLNISGELIGLVKLIKSSLQNLLHMHFYTLFQ